MATTPKNSVPVPPAGKRLLTPAEAGAALGYGENHIRDLIKSRQLRGVKVRGEQGRKVLRVTSVDLDAYLSKLETSI